MRKKDILIYKSEGGAICHWKTPDNKLYYTWSNIKTEDLNLIVKAVRGEVRIQDIRKGQEGIYILI